MTCTYPGGPTVSFPRPAGWPAYFGTSSKNYHAYNEWVNTAFTNKKCIEDYLRTHPTPGTPQPATPQGTPNDATPSGLGDFGPSPVQSYASTDSNGNPVVINVTLPGHPLFPGYVARNVTGGPNNNQVNNYGEGTGWPQAGWSPIATPINNVWQGLTEEAINACRCKN